jgi:hypothetical protein
MAKHAKGGQLQAMGAVALLASFMFFFVWWTGTRQDRGAFGGKVWWNWTRPIHSLMLGIFAVLALSGSSDSWRVLVADAALGLGFFAGNKLHSMSIGL